MTFDIRNNQHVKRIEPILSYKGSRWIFKVTIVTDIETDPSRPGYDRINSECLLRQARQYIRGLVGVDGFEIKKEKL
ncbi:MAG: hypothetical protein HQL37_04595 [Alphaproteobacteria bacterium]|nr:hypothetical protein [Alphaproteobacteria bacterium]